MIKRILLIIFLLLTIQSSVKVLAVCPVPNTCTTIGMSCCISEGVNPTIGFEPPTNNALKNNCTALTPLVQYRVPHQYGSVGKEQKIGITQGYSELYKYCKVGTSFKATAAGELIIFSENVFIEVFINGTYITKYSNLAPNEKLTGRQVAIGDEITIKLGEKESDYGPGWRAYSEMVNGVEELNFPWDQPGLINKVNAARLIANTKGYTIISEQLWGDASNSYTYDTFDFEDLILVVAVGKSAPNCNDYPINLYVDKWDDPSKIYLSERAKFTVIPSSPSLYKYIGNLYSPNNFALSSCSPSSPKYLGPENNYVLCNIENKGNTNNPTLSTWTHQYQLCDGTLCSPICSATKDFQVWPYPGILRTINGDTYIGKDTSSEPVIEQVRYNKYYEVNSDLKYSTFTFGTESSSLTKHLPSEIQILSSKGSKSILKGYQDGNSYPNYYDRFATKLLQDGRLNLKTISNSTNLNDSYFVSLRNEQDANNKVQLINVTNSSTLTITNSTCRTKTIFLIDGNLILNPHFNISGDNACLFIVRGSAIIDIVGNQDQIKAFILTEKFITTNSKVELNLKGGIISKTNELNRNINIDVIQANSINKSKASEFLNFEGARYMRHFKDYLPNPFYVSIKEIQYIN